MTKIFNGKTSTQKKEKLLSKKVADFEAKTGITPKIVSIVVGHNPASHLYLKHKQQSALRTGIAFEKVEFPENIRPDDLIAFIEEKNLDNKVHGIMVQLPLPARYEIRDTRYGVLNAINPGKDVDCLTTINFSLLAAGKPRFLPATVKAILAIIENCSPRAKSRGKLKIVNSNIVVVGVSNIVGKPLALLLSQKGAKVTTCRSKTTDLAGQTRKADILVSATGVPNLIKGNMVKKGAVVIDVGSPKGDVDSLAALKASFFTPVPGGVGPVTVISLMENVLQAALMQECPELMKS